RVKEFKERVILRLRRGIEFLLNKYNVELIKDRAIFENEREIKLVNSNKRIKGENFIIATGSKPLFLKNIEKQNEIIWTSEEALNFEKIPERLLIIGAGIIGLELGTIYFSFGSKVIFIEITNQILPGIDFEIANYLKNLLERKGFIFYLNSILKEIDINKRKAKIETKDKGEIEIDFDNILLAVGRKPRSEELNLSNLILDDFGYIKTDKKMMTNIKGIYAIGDVRKPPLLAHKAMYEGKKVVEIIFQDGEEEDVYIPNCIYTEPEIATIGITEEEAKSRGLEVIISKVPLSTIGRSLTMGKSEGFGKIICDKNKKEILGLHLIMPNASEIIGEGSIFLNLKLNLEKIKKVIHPHPTLSEIIEETFLSAIKEAIHNLPYG
ncbi:MAG: NAD(P)/FAD-dependent oxidoreductase, partial [candidate division WOR-3 bacterium]|nr:NAD(P)/FAD-dependent oxidoreductase [candidate division WOR-3 bacterium]